MASEAKAGQSIGDAVQEIVLHHVQDNPHAWHIGGLEVPIPFGLSLHMLMVLFTLALLGWLFLFLYRKDDKVPSGITNFLEIFVIFIRDEICIAYLGEEDGRRMTPTFLTVFFFILIMNLMGLVPGFATATSNLSITLALATVVFVMMTAGAIHKNGFSGFFNAFVPHGVPLPVLIIIVPLELAGVLIKAGVLALRLMANMLAGHIALFSVLGLILIYGAAGTPAGLMGLFVFFLEIFVAFLQTYIFTMLSAMFIGQIYHPEH